MLKANYKILFFIFLLSNCSQSSEKLSVEKPRNIIEIEEEFFVFLDSQGWELNKNYNFFRCEKKKFNINIHDIYSHEINKLLKNVFLNLKINDFAQFNDYNNKLFFKISQKKALAKFDYNGDQLEFTLILNGQISLFNGNEKIFDSKIRAEGSAIRKDLFFCNPKKVAKVAVEIAMTKYLELVYKNITKAIEMLNKNDI